MKLGISIKIDVSKIDKSRLFKGQKGTYLDLTTFIDTNNPSQYGDHGFISQSVNKEEREQGVQTPILGNCKVVYGLEQANQGQYQQGGQGGYQHNPDEYSQRPQTRDQYRQPQNGQPQGGPDPIPDDDIPF